MANFAMSDRRFSSSSTMFYLSWNALLAIITVLLSRKKLLDTRLEVVCVRARLQPCRKAAVRNWALAPAKKRRQGLKPKFFFAIGRHG
jgi:hypothetical protein